MASSIRAIHSLFWRCLASGVYNIPACDIRLSGIYTNKVPVDAYRGAGRPEAAYVISRRSRVRRSNKPEGSRDRRRQSTRVRRKIDNFIQEVGFYARSRTRLRKGWQSTVDPLA